MTTPRLSSITIEFIAALLTYGTLGGPASTGKQPPNPLHQAMLDAIFPLQTSASSCGYAAAAALLNTVRIADRCAQICADTPSGETPGPYGPHPLENDFSLYEQLKKPVPISLGDIQSVLADDGLTAKAFLVRPSTLAALVARAPLPLVLHLEREFQHFVLALDANAHAILVFDPAQGLAAQARADIEASASGHCLVLAPTGNDPLGRGMRIVRDLLWRMVDLETGEDEGPDKHLKIEELAVFWDALDISQLQIDLADEPEEEAEFGIDAEGIFEKIVCFAEGTEEQ